MAAALEARILGPVELVSPTGASLRPRSHHQRALLARLVLARGHPVAASTLIGTLWPTDGPADPRKSLQVYVSELRRLLGSDAEEARKVLSFESGSYRLRLPMHSVDLLRFEAHLRAAEELESRGAFEAALAETEAALAEWRGSPLGDPAEPGPFLADVAELEALNERALELRCELYLQLDRHDTLLPDLERLVFDRPHNERFHVFRMVALHRAGRSADALRAYSHARDSLIEAAGIEPGQELRQVEMAILRSDSDLVLAGPVESDDRGVDIPEPRLIGRTQELAVLDASSSTTADHTQIVLVEGEAGVGKSRLLREWASRERRRGASVAWGRCRRTPLPPLAPVLRAIDQLVTARGPRSVDLASLDLDVLGELWPQLAAGSATAGAAIHTAPERLDRAVCGLVRALAAQCPTVLILDDVHWIDPDTARLVTSLVESLDAPNLVIVVVRRSPGSSAPYVDALMTAVRRLGTAALHVPPLSPDDIGEWMESLESGPVDPEDAAVIHQRTGGIPIFVAALLARHAGDGATTPPETFRNVVLGWLADVPAETRRAIDAAATLGIAFEPKALARVLGIATRRLPSIFQTARSLGILAPTNTTAWRFVHDLVHEAVYQDLDETERAALHARAAAVLGRGPNTSTGDLLVAAHHARAAGDSADPALALPILEAAGGLAGDLLSYGVAADHYHAAREALDRLAPAPDQRSKRLDLLLAEGEMRMRAGDPEVASKPLHLAVELARELGDNLRKAEAIHSLARRRSPHGLIEEPETVALLEEGLAACRGSGTELEIRMLDFVAGSLSLTDATERASALAREAVAISERIAEPGARAIALTGAHTVLWYPHNASERLRLADEAIGCARTAGAMEQECLARIHRHIDLLELGRRSEAGAALRLAEQRAEMLNRRVFRWMVETWKTVDAMASGDCVAAEQQIHDGLAMWGDTPPPDVVAAHATQTICLRFLGRGEPVADLAGAYAELLPELPVWRCTYAYALAESGQARAALGVVDALLDEGLDTLRQDATFLPACSVLAEVVSSLDHRPLAERLRPVLDAHAASASTVNVFGAGGHYAGPMLHHLAIVHAALGRWDRAEAEFREAIALNEADGAVALAARSRLSWARALVRRGHHRDMARELLATVSQDARRFGLTSLAQEAATLGA